MFCKFKTTLKDDSNTAVSIIQMLHVLVKVYPDDGQYTGYTQKNGAVSKVNKKFISHLTRAQRTPSAAATV